MRTELFDYDLPEELIAAVPAEQREHSRLLVVPRADPLRLQHRRFSDIVDYLQPGDLLVVNDSRVLRARVRGAREATGARAELLLLERRTHAQHSLDTWSALARPAKRMRVGDAFIFGSGSDSLRGRVLEAGEGGLRVFGFETPDLLPWLERHGEIPLPPYIEQRRRELAGLGEVAQVDDAERYQTVYAREAGSVAAPTAGLHFTPELLARLEAHGIQRTEVTLHVGMGTFRPMETETIEEHPMHTERFLISEEAAGAVNRARQEGRRVVAVGTTSVRALESAARQSEGNALQAGSYETNLMIAPGYDFKVVDALITNFHLPRSTLLLLVSALVSREAILHAYAEAVRERYRFYSYGDAMLIA